MAELDPVSLGAQHPSRGAARWRVGRQLVPTARKLSVNESIEDFAVTFEKLCPCDGVQNRVKRPSVLAICFAQSNRHQAFHMAAWAQSAVAAARIPAMASL